MRAKLSPETKSLLACTLSNWVAHSSFILIPLLKLPFNASRSALMVISLVAGLIWLVGIRSRSPLTLLVLVPSMWGASLIYSDLHIKYATASSQTLIKLDASAPELLSQSIPALELLTYLITFGAYLASTLIWLSSSSTSKHPQPSQSFNRLEQVTRIPRAQHRSSPYPKMEWLLVYWCSVTPLTLYLWGQHSTLEVISSDQTSQVMSQRELSLLLSTSAALTVIMLTLGATWVLLRSAPPALLYLEERGEWTLSRAWRRWAWGAIFVGGLLVLINL